MAICLRGYAVVQLCGEQPAAVNVQQDAGCGTQGCVLQVSSRLRLFLKTATEDRHIAAAEKIPHSESKIR